MVFEREVSQMFGVKVGRSAAIAAVMAGVTFAGAALPSAAAAESEVQVGWQGVCFGWERSGEGDENSSLELPKLSAGESNVAICDDMAEDDGIKAILDPAVKPRTLPAEAASASTRPEGKEPVTFTSLLPWATTASKVASQGKDNQVRQMQDEVQDTKSNLFKIIGGVLGGLLGLGVLGAIITAVMKFFR